MQYAVSALGWPVVLIGGLGALVLIGSYCVVAFSDPGIVYKELDEEELLAGATNGALINCPPIAPEIFKNPPRVIQKIECGHCKIKRPLSATQYFFLLLYSDFYLT